MGDKIMLEMIDGGLSVDDRGQVTFVNKFDFKNVKRFYMVENHEVGFVRAWHGHMKESKYVFVPQGSALIGAVKIPKNELVNLEAVDNSLVEKFVLSSNKPQVLYIPSGYANGFMTLKENTKVMFFSTSTLEDSLNDDIRFDWDRWDIWNIERR